MWPDPIDRDLAIDVTIISFSALRMPSNHAFTSLATHKVEKTRHAFHHYGQPFHIASDPRRDKEIIMARVSTE